MTVTHHRIKTHGGWDVQQPFPGIYLWRDPHGGFYLVDHTGTRRLHGNNDQDGPGNLMIAEFWHSPPMEIDWAALRPSGPTACSCRCAYLGKVASGGDGLVMHCDAWLNKSARNLPCIPAGSMGQATSPRLATRCQRWPDRRFDSCGTTGFTSRCGLMAGYSATTPLGSAKH